MEQETTTTPIQVTDPEVTMGKLMNENTPTKTMFIYGEKKIDGFVNIGPGTALEFNPTEQWPFADGIADEIALHDVLNRIPASAVVHFVREAYRILKPFGMIDIVVPVRSHPMFVNDIFQQTEIGEHTFRFFSAGECDNLPEDSLITPAARWIGVNLSQMAHEVSNDAEDQPFARWIKLVKMG